jgi:thioredoxin 1
MKTITSKELQEKINNKENFYLDIKASWCGPCKVLLKSLEDVTKLVKESTGNDKPIYVFDVDEDRDYALQTLNVRSVPTTKLYKNGEEIYTKTGILRREEIVELINQI